MPTAIKTHVIKGAAALLIGLTLLALASWLLVVRASAAKADAAPVLLHSAYERGAVQCRGTNQTGLRCARRTRSATGLCYRHLGQGVKVVNVTP